MFPIFEKSQTVPSHDDDSSQPDVIETDHFHHIVFGSDQLTCARAGGGLKGLGRILNLALRV